MSKDKLIPELRFPEFESHTAWKEQMLGDKDISTIVRGGSPRPITEYLTNNKDGLNWLKIGDVDKASKYVVETEDKVLPSALTKTRKVFPGDLIMSNSMSFGRPYILKIQTCIHDGWIAVTEISEEIDTDFLYYLILSDGSQRYFKDSAAGGGIKNLNAEIIKKLPIAIPSRIEEQQKIASCLSSLDELLAAHNEKLEALKDHKKGLLQNLFPQEGETVPKVRFPEFEGDGEWVEKKLGEMTTKVGSGKTPKGGDKNYKSSGRPFVRSQNIGWGILLIDDMAFIDEDTHSTFLSSEIKSNDVLLNITGASIGRSAIANEKIAKGNVNQHVCIIRTKNELNAVFLNQYLISQYGQKQIDSFQAGGNRQGLNFSQIRSLDIPTPPTIQEQQKIASCLSAVDELINAQQEKIEQLQQHKKGLMQGLFPKMTD